MINIVYPGKSNTKLCAAEYRFKSFQFNDIPGVKEEI